MNRLIYIDNIKVLGNALRCMVHASVPYMVTYSSMWPIDDKGSYFFDFAIFESHLFIMELFFLLTGFMFVHQLRKKSPLRILKERLQKIVLPFIVGLVVLMPIVLSYFQLPDPSNYGWINWKTYSSAYRKAWQIGLDNFFPTGHLWFLYYLLYFYGFSLILHKSMRRIVGVLEKLPMQFILLVLMSISAFCFFFLKRWLVDNPLTLIPEWPSLVHYYIFFFLGMVIGESNSLSTKFENHAKHLLICGLILGFFAIIPQLFFEKKDHEFYDTIKVIAIILHVPATFLITLGVWFYFKTKSRSRNKYVEYLSDANYWIYISFLPLAMLVHILLLPLDFSIFIKFIITYISALVISLISYEYLVRYTIIGATMNSRKYRNKR